VRTTAASPAWMQIDKRALHLRRKALLFDGVYTPYLNKREALLDALTKFAHDEFQ
jgi:hypothetical protein